MNSDSFVRVIFADRRKKSTEYRKVTLRPVSIKGEYMYQAEYHYDKKVTHRNISYFEGISFAEKLIEEDFKQINILTEDEDIQILASKPDKPRITRSRASHKKQKRFFDLPPLLQSPRHLPRIAGYSERKMSRVLNFTTNILSQYFAGCNHICHNLSFLCIADKNRRAVTRILQVTAKISFIFRLFFYRNRKSRSRKDAFDAVWELPDAFTRRYSPEWDSPRRSLRRYRG